MLGSSLTSFRPVRAPGRHPPAQGRASLPRPRGPVCPVRAPPPGPAVGSPQAEVPLPCQPGGAGCRLLEKAWGAACCQLKGQGTELHRPDGGPAGAREGTLSHPRTERACGGQGAWRCWGLLWLQQEGHVLTVGREVGDPGAPAGARAEERDQIQNAARGCAGLQAWRPLTRVSGLPGVWSGGRCTGLGRGMGKGKPRPPAPCSSGGSVQQCPHDAHRLGWRQGLQLGAMQLRWPGCGRQPP